MSAAMMATRVSATKNRGREISGRKPARKRSKGGRLRPRCQQPGQASMRGQRNTHVRILSISRPVRSGKGAGGAGCLRSGASPRVRRPPFASNQLLAHSGTQEVGRYPNSSCAVRPGRNPGSACAPEVALARSKRRMAEETLISPARSRPLGGAFAQGKPNICAGAGTPRAMTNSCIAPQGVGGQWASSLSEASGERRAASSQTSRPGARERAGPLRTMPHRWAAWAARPLHRAVCGSATSQDGGARGGLKG